MADQTNIEWADATCNPLRAVTADGKKGWHCEHVSEGCRNCYAETFNVKRLGTGLPFKPGNRDQVQHILDEKLLLAPLRRRKPTRYFLSSMTDVFGAWVPDKHLDRIFAVMALAPQHTFMVLTKRPERMRDYLVRDDRVGEWLDLMDEIDGQRGSGLFSRFPLPNVWLGTSVEDQRAADERIPHLLATPAAVRFLSCEPLLGPVSLTNMDINGHIASRRLGHIGGYWINALSGKNDDMGRPCPDVPSIDWIIAGGESGSGARPMHPDWARSLRDQCAAAGVAFHFKQWGEWGRVADQRPAPDYLPQDANTLTRCGKARAGRLLDGRTHDEFPGGPATTAAPITDKEVPY